MGVSCGGNLRDTWDRATDRCSRFFPCISDPAQRSALSLKVALVTLHLVFSGVLFLFDHDLIEKTKQEPWYTAIYVLLFVATLIQYFVTSGTSPGYVLDAQKDVDERDASARRTLLASKQPASSKNGSVVITVDGRNYHRGNATAWTKLVMDLYPPGQSTRNLTCPYCHVLQSQFLPRTQPLDLSKQKKTQDPLKSTKAMVRKFRNLGSYFGWLRIRLNRKNSGHSTEFNRSYFGWLRIRLNRKNSGHSTADAVHALLQLLMHRQILNKDSTFPKNWYFYLDFLGDIPRSVMELIRWYICEETALCLWTSILYIGYLKSNISEAWWVDVIMIVLLAALSISLIFLLLLLLFHRGIPERVYPFNKGVCRNLYLFCFAKSSMYRMEPLPTREELDEKAKPYTCFDVLSCRCC
ncbi:hypothetical protein DH2020_046316 [Rehmannia glutinosa]|uniref:Uncharacterized protein n=1 Tax=Rehmannia glutinosa TaxID=99300 RepID=A0ABR0UC98_REHGL